MPHILLINTYFPPTIPAGALRLFRFANHLPELGWEVTVATADVLYPIRLDHSLVPQLSGKVEITRLPENGAQAWGLPNSAAWFLKRVCRRLRWPTPYPDQFSGWARRVPAWAEQKHRRRPFDLILASLPGWSSLEAGFQTQRRLGVPWIVDIRDPYGIRNGAGDHVTLPPHLEDRHHQDMRRCLQSAAAVVIIFDKLRQAFIDEYPEVSDLAGKSHVIANGWDRVNGFDPVTQPPPQNEKFRLVHVGTTTGIRMEGFFEALSLFLAELPQARGKILVEFAGEGSPEIFEPVERLRLADVIRFIGPVSLVESQKLCCAADVLLFFFYIPVSQPLVPGSKVYTYLACRRPVLCSAVPGTTRRLYEESGRHLYADPCKVSENLQALRTYYHAWENGTLHSSFGSRADASEQYEGFNLTRQLSAVLEAVLAGK